VIAGEPGSWVAAETAETTTPAADELARLFAQAWEASGFDRISFRDPIAERGAEAITYALRELESHPSSGFPVQVIEAVGHRGHASPAAAALVEIARRYPGQHGLADAARARLPVNSGVPSTRSSAPTIPYGDLPVHGAEPPQHVGYCDFLTARAVPCENYGRYRRGEYWACSSHAKAQNPRPIPPRAR
jgi:hypothetical protein